MSEVGKKIEFEGLLEAGGEGGNWTLLHVPFSVEKAFGSRGRVSVSGQMNGVSFRSSLFPTGDGGHHLIVNKSMRKSIGAGPGDRIRVSMQLDSAERDIEPPAELAAALKKSSAARRAFEALGYSRKKYFADWVATAKKAETKASRVARAIEMLKALQGTAPEGPDGPPVESAGTDETAKIAGVSNEAVLKKTGRGWGEWISLLDRAGAGEMSHRDIAAFLQDRHQVSPWWSQTVTVGYEQERGGRDKHQKPDGYSVGASKTISAPLAELFRAWSEPGTRRRWLSTPSKLAIRKATENRSLRVALEDGTSLDVMFYAKGERKSQVTVTQNKIGDRVDAERLKTEWKVRLEKLKQFLEE